VNLPLSSLVVGERVVSRCDGGLLEAEYALFDRSEVVLTAIAGQGAREEGYLTTAAFARARLYEALITADLAHEAFQSMRTRHMRPLARSPAVVDIVDQLGPYEAFEGGALVAERGRYTGVWIDLEALASACPLREAPILFQALHLILVLEEVTEDVPVRLLTAQYNEVRRPGERTWRKVTLEAAQRLPWVLREMQAPARSQRSLRDEADVREDILRNLRARATASAMAQPRLHMLATAVARTGWTPPAGIPAETGAPITERNPRIASTAPPPPSRRRSPAPPHPSSQPPGRTALRQSPPPPRPSPSPPLDTAIAVPLPPLDPLPNFADLRRHTDLLKGTDHLRAVAQSLSALAERSSFAPDLAMLAARAWLAAGEQGYARHFARHIVEDPSGPDEVRIAALEILDATPKTHESTRPPPAAMINPLPVIVLSAEGDRAVPRGASLPPMSTASSANANANANANASTAAYEPPSVLTAPVSPRLEIVETLRLPPGLTEEMLAAGSIPRNAPEARVAMTRLARHLGRDYRLWYGTTLMTDVMAVDAMQRHLRRRFADGPLDERHARELQVELTRHGALMSEILARSLGAQWLDLSSPEPGRWSMRVPPSVTVWPIGRLYRFYGQGHREADLVAFYMELESGAQRA
jgi:hypothetical protein